MSPSVVDRPSRPPETDSSGLDCAASGRADEAAAAQAPQEPIPPPDREVHRLEAVDEPDPLVAEVDEELRRSLEGPAIVHIDP